MNVLVLHDALAADARADERDVLDQADAVVAALAELGHRPHVASLLPDLQDSLRLVLEQRPDVVFNLVESVDGAGRGVDLVPAMLERSGVPFTGAGAQAMRVAASKTSSKELLAAGGLPTPLWATAEQLRAGVALPAGRYIVKSVWEHGSLGLEPDCVVAVGSAAELWAEVDARTDRLGGSAFAEAFVAGREFNLAMLADGRDPQHLPPAEIRFAADLEPGSRIVGYRAKWSPGSVQDEATPRAFDVAPADRTLVARMQQLAAAVWRLFELRGYARVDFRVDSAGEPWIIDVNTNPCLTPGAGFSAALEQAGISFPTAVARMLSAAQLRQDP